MNDAFLVRGFERFGDLLGNREPPHCSGPALMRLASVSAVNQFHHQRVSGFFDAIDLGDIGVIQRGQHFGFALEAGQPFGIIRDRSGRILMATSRSSFVSRARYTSPIPPAPMGARIS